MWSSGRILEFTIRSMINRQRFSNENKILRVSAKSLTEITEAVYEVVEPLKYQMKM